MATYAQGGWITPGQYNATATGPIPVYSPVATLSAREFAGLLSEILGHEIGMLQAGAQWTPELERDLLAERDKRRAEAELETVGFDEALKSITGLTPGQLVKRSYGLPDDADIGID